MLHETCDLLLTGGSVVTLDEERRVLEPGAVAISGDRILAVGTTDELARYQARRTIRCDGKAVLPGLVDCHNHLFMTLGRGLGDGRSLAPWLCDFMWPYATSISSEEARSAAYLGAIEAARAGTTCIVDNHYAPSDLETTLAVAGAVEDVGLRGVITRGIIGHPNDLTKQRRSPEELFRYSPQDELDITRACIEARPPGSRVTVWPAPLNITYVDQELVRQSVELARELDTGWHCHCAEVRSENEVYVEAYGIRPVEWLYEEGLLDDRATIAHGIWINDREVEELGGTRTGISHNPISNQYLASGVLRLRELRDAGAVVGLGSDGASCTHRQDIFECVKQAVLLQRSNTLDPGASYAEEALELATREGAQYARIDAGFLASGKLADVIVVNLDRPHLRPLNRIVATLAYAARGSDVEITIVGGEIVYEEGHCTRVDEQVVMQEAEVRALQLVERAGLKALRNPWRNGESD